MMKLSNLTVRFGGVVALDSVDCVLDAPITGLIGPNGAGKTTMLNVISGFTQLSEGSVMLDGVDLVRHTPRMRAFSGLRRSFQQEMVAEDLTLQENLASVADNLCRTRSEARSSVAAAMDHLGLTKHAGVLGAKLDHFQRRMTEVAKTLIGVPKIILLDEPGAGLNEFEALALRRAVQSIPTWVGARVVLIDHDADLISAICDETLVLDFGRKIAHGQTASVLKDPVVLQAYLG